MAVSRLWKLLISKGITKVEMEKSGTVSMETLARITFTLDCEANDIIEFTCNPSTEGA